jgi:hypothetical protein
MRKKVGYLSYFQDCVGTPEDEDSAGGKKFMWAG